MRVLGSFIPFYEKIPHAQKAQNAHKRIKTKKVFFMCIKTSKRKKAACFTPCAFYTFGAFCAFFAGGIFS